MRNLNLVRACCGSRQKESKAVLLRFKQHEVSYFPFTPWDIRQAFYGKHGLRARKSQQSKLLALEDGSHIAHFKD